jgi:hypothetical protein
MGRSSRVTNLALLATAKTTASDPVDFDAHKNGPFQPGVKLLYGVACKFQFQCLLYDLPCGSIQHRDRLLSRM